MIDLPSVSSPEAIIAGVDASGTCTTSMYDSSMPCRSAVTSTGSVPRNTKLSSSVKPIELWNRASSVSDAASRPTSSISSRRAVVSGGSSATSRLPAGISSTRSSTAARYWRTMTTCSSSVNATTDTAPGCRTISRWNREPSGASNSESHRVMT